VSLKLDDKVLERLDSIFPGYRPAQRTTPGSRDAQAGNVLPPIVQMVTGAQSRQVTRSAA
jgi:hypothetical protein